ncbi:MAG: YihY/virulence factor BrkB family protein, partial [Haloechinothrix sp.]
STLIELGYWPAVALASILALASLYHLSVPVRSPWRRDLPGAALAMVLGLAGSFGLRAYLESTAKYGVLSAPIGVLLFFFVTALAVLLGAELNAEIDKMWPTTSTSEGRHRSRHDEPATPD